MAPNTSRLTSHPRKTLLIVRQRPAAPRAEGLTSDEHSSSKGGDPKTPKDAVLPRGEPGSLYALIHRSAWKGSSPKLDFRLAAFSEVRRDEPRDISYRGCATLALGASWSWWKAMGQP